VLVAATWLVARRAGWVGRSSRAPKNLLVITLDTIRTDRIGAYGSAKARTPAIDGLARRGVLFEHCVAAAPLTLPSHTSLFTGTYPVFHGVRDNGDFVVPPDLTTLAELFQARGYRTGAFVGAFVLDSRWGLKKGFQTYADDFDLHQEDVVSIGDIRRPGNEVVDRALAWLRTSSSTPFFVWVHLYDPHAPYDPPSPFKEEYPSDPYSAEVAFADAQIGRLIRFLEESGEARRTMVVFAGDHGESLGEHGERGHGFFAYQQTLRVPFMVALPAAKSAGVRSPETVSLVDVFPTVAQLFGIPIPAQAQGRSLEPLLFGQGAWSEKPQYAETYYAKLHYGWSPLTSIQERRYQFIESSEPELYDLESDPQETENLLVKNPALAAAMRGRLEAIAGALGKNARSAGHKSDPETIAKLASLGYLSGSIRPDSPQDKTLPSPRSKIATYNRLNEARDAAANGQWRSAETILEGITRTDPEVIDAYSSLGGVRAKQGRFAEAIPAYREAMRRRPDDPALVIGFATTLLKGDRPEEAERILHDALLAIPSDPRLFFLLGTVQEAQGHDDEAITSFRKTLELNPRSAPAHASLAAIYGKRGEASALEEEAKQALALDPKVEGVHFARAEALAREGKSQEAIAEYLQETQAAPADVRPVYALAGLYRKLGRTSDEEAALKKSIELAPRFAPAYLHLAKLALDRGMGYPEAIRLVRAALDLHPRGEDLAFADFLLADLYNRVGDQERSRDYARKGESARRRPTR
jgi:arylsulfatase A-like enzyme/Tfp pilus assembly protein PilF